MTGKKLTIQVRDYHGASHHASTQFDIVEDIQRKVWAEAIGNFNPLFCRYKGKRMLVHADGGDVSDPFRRTADQLQKLYIVVNK